MDPDTRSPHPNEPAEGAPSRREGGTDPDGRPPHPEEPAEGKRPEWADGPEAAYRERQSEEWQDPSLPNTVPAGGTVEADRADARAAHEPDEVDEAAAASAPEGPVADSVARSYEEAAERGARVEGEGRISGG